MLTDYVIYGLATGFQRLREAVDAPSRNAGSPPQACGQPSGDIVSDARLSFVSRPSSPPSGTPLSIKVGTKKEAILSLFRLQTKLSLRVPRRFTTCLQGLWKWFIGKQLVSKLLLQR